jgi:hypothetical protein
MGGGFRILRGLKLREDSTVRRRDDCYVNGMMTNC